jgi:predicted permease
VASTADGAIEMMDAIGWLTRFGRRVQMLFPHGQFDADLEEEMRLHQELRKQEQVERGVSPEEARYAAQRRFGNKLALREESRDMWGWNWLETFLQDVRYGLRQLRRNPGFTIVAVLTLALGIGANTAIFSVIEAVLLAPPPYREPSRLVLLTDAQDPDNGGFLYRDLSTFLSQATDLKAIAFYYRDSGFSRVELTTSDGREYVQGAFVSANFFSVMGLRPELGRVFTAEEVQQQERVVVLSHRLWLDRFGGSRDAVGKSLPINGASYKVIGVMPLLFQFPASDQQFWAPITTNPYWGEALIPDTNPLKPKHNRYFYERWQAIGRLRSRVSLAQAKTQVSVIIARLRQQDPDENRSIGINLVPLHVRVGSQARLALYVLLGAVCFVLLIACTNVANLVLARGAVRRREMAVRSALGASRARLIRQLVTENAVLALFAGSVAVALASAGVRALVALAPATIPRINQAGINPGVLAFALTTAFVAALMSGLVPARTMSRVDLNESLASGSRSASGSVGKRMRGILVVVEFALAIVLLVGAGLLLRSLLAALSVNPGFEPTRLLTMSISPSATTLEVRNTFYNQVLRRVRAMPGIQAAGEVSELFELEPMNPLSLRVIEGRAPEPKDQWTPMSWVSVRGDFFQAMGARLLRGRYFNASDGPDSPLVAIIDESMARRFWPGEDPIGRRFKGFDPRGHNDDWITVIGVVPDMRRSGLEKQPIPHIYEPYTQAIDGDRTGDLVVRTFNSPTSVASTVREIVLKLDSAAILSSVTTVQSDLWQQLAPERFETWLLGLFALIALVLANVGIFGVVHYSVAQRTHEIGIRMALGAQQRDVLRMIVRESLLLGGTGIAIGIGGALALTQFLRSLLFEVKPMDPATFLFGTVLMIAVAVLGCYVPARRAMRVDPMVALRYE